MWKKLEIRRKHEEMIKNSTTEKEQKWWDKTRNIALRFIIIDKI